MASGRLGAYDLLENIPQSIYVCPTDDLASATVNVVNRRTDYANVTLAITDAPNIITDTDAYLEIEVPIPPKGVMERTQVMIPSGKYLTVKSDKKFVNVTAWGATVGLLSDPQPNPIPVSATNFVTDGGFDAGDFSAYTVTNSGGGFLQVINGAAVLQDTTGTTSISQTFTVTQGALVNYQFDVTLSDFTTQTVTVTNGATPITVNVNSTGTYKGQFIAESTSVTITLAVSTGQVGYDNIYVWDNAEVAPTYILSLDDTSYNENATITATLSTTNVPDGRTVDYTVTGIDANDIASGNLTGTLTISSGTATVAWTLAEDATTEGNELFTVTLDTVDSIGLPTNSPSASSIVVDTSLTP